MSRYVRTAWECPRPAQVEQTSLAFYIWTSLTSCTVTDERHKTWAVNMGIDAHPANKGLNVQETHVYAMLQLQLICTQMTMQ